MHHRGRVWCTRRALPEDPARHERRTFVTSRHPCLAALGARDAHRISRGGPSSPTAHAKTAPLSFVARSKMDGCQRWQTNPQMRPVSITLRAALFLGPCLPSSLAPEARHGELKYVVVLSALLTSSSTASSCGSVAHLSLSLWR